MIVKSLERVSTPSTMHHSHWRVLDQIEDRLRNGHANHLGYPYNLVGQNAAPPQFADYLVNNLGDPYVGSHYGSEVCDLEREVARWLMDLWGCSTHEEYWGSVGASGTEGNLWALYLGREAFPQAPLLHSAEAHYSIPKAARILSMRARSIACEPSGAIDIAALKTTLCSIESPSVILALTCGTTVKGAHDDIGAAIAALDAAGFGPERRFIHVDGALNAMVLPFVEEAPSSLQPACHRLDFDVGPQDDRNDDAVRRARGAPRARRPRRLGRRLSSIQRHDPDGIAQRACRHVPVVPADGPRDRGFPPGCSCVALARGPARP
jgi:hypothetical protein